MTDEPLSPDKMTTHETTPHESTPHETTPHESTPHETTPHELTPHELLLDAVGLRCPLPVIRLAKAARTAPPGTVITLLTTDPAAEPDVAAWCRMRGHHLLAQDWLDQAEGHPPTLRHTIQTPR